MLANKTFLFVDKSSPDLFRGTREKSLSITIPILDIWSRSGDIRDQSRKLSEPDVRPHGSATPSVKSI